MAGRVRRLWDGKDGSGALSTTIFNLPVHWADLEVGVWKGTVSKHMHASGHLLAHRSIENVKS